MHQLKKLISSKSYNHGWFTNDTAFQIVYQDTENRFWARAWGKLKACIPTNEYGVNALGGMSWKKEGEFYVCEYRTSLDEQKRLIKRRSPEILQTVSNLNEISTKHIDPYKYDEKHVLYLNGAKIGSFSKNMSGNWILYATKYKRILHKIRGKYLYEQLYDVCKTFKAYYLNADRTVSIDCTGQRIGFMLKAKDSKKYEAYVKEQMGIVYWKESPYYATKWISRREARRFVKENELPVSVCQAKNHIPHS